MNKKYNLKLDLQFRCNNSIMKFNQFDNNTSDFFIKISNGGKSFDVEKAIVVLAIIKPSGKAASQFVEVENGLVYADLKPNMRDEIGIYTAQAMLILEDERVVTDVISYEVEEDKIFSLLNDTVGTSEEFTLLTDMLSRLSAIEISEEQRVINEAERILSEENRKIEEAKRVEAELIRQHEEADRAKYDATRESNENIRKINEEARISSENVRLENEANRIEQEANRVKAEQLRKDNYNLMTEDEERRRSEANAHKEAEVLRVQAETNRVNEEAKRRTTEQARVSAENTRVSNENTRKANETTRQTNETHRVEAETQRQNRYNSFILEAEANANNFENYTNNAKIKEEERKSNELDRKSQEDRRVSNEVERISNENTRKANENARIESEKQRVDAENLRKEKIIEIQSDYDSLKKVIIDENASANLQNQINQTNSQLEHKMNRGDKIKSSQLDTSSNSSKIGLNNLSDEVHQAMSGNAPVNPTIPDGSLTTEKYADNSITDVKIRNQYLHPMIYAQNSKLDFTFDNSAAKLKVSVGTNAYLIVGTKYIPITGDNRATTFIVNYPSTDYDGVTTLWFIPSTKNFLLANFREYDTHSLGSNTEAYLVATIAISSQVVNAIGEFTINGKEVKDGSIHNNAFLDSTITGNKLVDRTILGSKINRQYLPIYLYADGDFDFTFDSYNRQLKMYVPAYAYACQGVDYYKLGTEGTPKTFVIPYPESDDGINYLTVDVSTSQLAIYNFKQFSTIKNNNNILILGTLSTYYRNIAVNGSYTTNGGGASKEIFIGFGEDIIVDKINRKIKIPPFYVKSRGDLSGNRYITPTKCGLEGNYFEYDIPQDYIFNVLSLDYNKLLKFNDGSTKNECPIVESQAANLPGYGIGCNIIVATMLYGQVTTTYPYKEVSYSSESVKDWGSYNGRGYINFNWKDGVIEFPSQGFVHYGTTYYTPNWEGITNHKIPIEDTKDGIQWLLFNLRTNKFKTLRYTGSSIDWSAGWVIIATFWVNNKVQMIGSYKINGKLLGENINVAVESNSDVDFKFNIDDNKLVLPDKMFFVKNEEIPIYLASIIPDDKKISSIKPSLIYKDGQTRKIESFYDSNYLHSDKLSETFRIGFRQYKDNKLYYKDITRVYCDPSTVSNKTPKILHIGDSITNRNIAYRNEQFLKEWGITPTYVGTVNNGTVSDKRRGEGREGWSYPNFTGKGNIWGNNGSVIVPKLDGNTTTLNQNPFIKIATEDDKTNYPQWCFRNTGVKRELSYEEDTDKSGDFYIFDMEHYLSSHGVETPDIITIALSTNDINRDSDALEMCKFNMQLMVSRIREQLPNAKIGIVPSPAWGFGNATFKSKVVQWIEECITIINNLDDDKVFIIPVWCHMNKEWGFPIGNVSDLSNINNSKVGSISDSIHLSTYGEEQYGKVMATFIANMI